MKKKSNASNVNWGVVLPLVVILVFLGSMLLIFMHEAQKADVRYKEYCEILDQGTSVEGEAVFRSSFGSRNVRLTYEVDGQAYTTEIQMTKKEFRRRHDSDKDNAAQAAVYYSTDSPEIALIKGAETAVLKTYKEYRNTAWFCGILLGLLGGGLLILGASNFMEKRKHTQSGNSFDFRTETEKRAERLADKPLREPLEGYAKEIVKLFDQIPDDSFRREKLLRAIGEKMNDNDYQMYVAYRAKHLATKAYEKGNRNMGEFSLRWLEYAWDGLGGWRS